MITSKNANSLFFQKFTTIQKENLIQNHFLTPNDSFLSNDDRQIAQHAIHGDEENGTILLQKDNPFSTKSSFRSLQRRNMVNDDVMNAYIKLLQSREESISTMEGRTMSICLPTKF